LRKRGFLTLDTLIFQHETGASRSATEIMDTRIDTDAYLVHLPDTMSIPQALGDKSNTWWKNPTAGARKLQDNCAAVWFLEDGFFSPNGEKIYPWKRLVYGEDWGLNIGALEFTAGEKLSYPELNFPPFRPYIIDPDFPYPEQRSSWILDKNIVQVRRPKTIFSRYKKKKYEHN
ncbi:MAG TPA: hypothetical protein VLJ15_04125, partial [Gammaproteobacteria bacterium]|nr:hypothetical protein [Gammaproteobacteria bacterium]